MRRCGFIFLAVYIVSLCFAGAIYAQLNINFVAVNPSETETKTINVEYFLPRELSPDDVLDTGPLKLEYNVDRNAMLVKGEMSFAPQESRTFKVRVKDVWKIDPAEIDLLKDQLDTSVAALKDHENYNAALFVRDQFFQEMDFILKRQNDFQGNIERRIEEYRANISTLERIRDDIYDKDFLTYHARAIQEQEEKEATVTMAIEVSNPSQTETKELKHRHFLPQEVRADDIIDSAGFDIRYDDKKEQLYLLKEEEFGPGETKKYNIQIKDIWHFSDLQVQDLRERAEIAIGELQATDFEESGNRLFGEINGYLDEIENAKALDTSVDRHIGIFRLSNRLYDKAYEDFKRIEQMISIVRAKKLQELESKRVRNVLERLKALRGLKQLSEALFKRKLSMNMTWKIIFATLGFVAFFTAFHFFMWAKRSKVMGEELGLKPGESLTEVPRPGENQEDRDEEE